MLPLSPNSGFDETFLSRTVFISLRNAAICAAGTVDFILADGLTTGAGKPGVALREARAPISRLLAPLSGIWDGIRLVFIIGGGGGGGGGGGADTLEERRASFKRCQKCIVLPEL